MFISGGIRILGPIFGGFLYGLGLTFNQILWVDVITFCLALFPTILVKIPPHKKASTEKKSYITEFKIGYDALMGIKGMPALFSVIIVNNTLITMFGALNVINFRLLGGEATDLAIRGIFNQVALLIGAAICMTRKKLKRKSLINITFGYAVVIMMSLTWVNGYLILNGYITEFYYIYAGSAIIGFMFSLVNTAWQTLLHELIPPDKLGRAFSADYAISFFLQPLAVLAAGPLYDLLGIQNLYLGIIIVSFTFQTIMLIFSNMRLVGKNIEENGVELKENQNHE
jgi:hypothetical protein